MSYRTGRHVFSDIQIELVFVTKVRQGALPDQALQKLEKIFKSVCKDFDATLLSFEGADFYVYIQVRYPPKVTVSKLVNSLKGVSSRKLKELLPTIEVDYWKDTTLWSPSYYARSHCGDSPLSIEDFINSQK